MKAHTQPQLHSLGELLRLGGVVPSSEWITGRGQHTRRRALPPFCAVVPAHQAQRLPGEVGAAARRLIKSRPRLRRLVAVDNLRAARCALRCAGLLAGVTLAPDGLRDGRAVWWGGGLLMPAGQGGALAAIARANYLVELVLYQFDGARFALLDPGAGEWWRKVDGRVRTWTRLGAARDALGWRIHHLLGQLDAGDALPAIKTRALLPTANKGIDNV